MQLPPKADCEPQRHIREFRLDQRRRFRHQGRVRPGRGQASRSSASAPSEEDGQEVRGLHRGSDPEGRAGAHRRRHLQGRARGGRDRHVEGPRHAGRDEAARTSPACPAAHGAKKVHRQAGSTSSLASNRGSGRPKKGLKPPGRYGNERVTIRNLAVVKVDAENNLLLVRGGIPGFPGALVMVRPTNKVGPGSPEGQDPQAGSRRAAQGREEVDWHRDNGDKGRATDPVGKRRLESRWSSSTKTRSASLAVRTPRACSTRRCGDREIQEAQARSDSESDQSQEGITVLTHTQGPPIRLGGLSHFSPGVAV